MSKSELLTTPVFRLAFPNVFEPVSFQGGKEKYRIVMLFDKHDETDPSSSEKKEPVINIFKRFAKKAVETKWPAEEKRPKINKVPYHDADEEGRTYAGYPGCWYIPASSMYKPAVIAQDGKTPIISEEIIYAGCYARAIISTYTFNKGSAGVAFGLQGLQKVRDGEKLAGGGLPDDAFESVDDLSDMQFITDKADSVDGIFD